MLRYFAGMLVVAAGAAGAVAPFDYLTADQVEASKQEIAARYQTARKHCDTQEVQAKDICVEEAKGHAKMAQAELQAYAATSARNLFVASKSKADAAHAAATKRCTQLTGHPKAECVQDAHLARVQAIAAAQVEEVRTAFSTDEAAHAARVAKVRKDTEQRVRMAQRQAAKVRCEPLQGKDEQRCLRDAQRL